MNLTVNLNAENAAVEKKKWHSDFPECMSSTDSPLRVTVETSNVAVKEEELITVF